MEPYQRMMNELFEGYARYSKILFAGIIRGDQLLGEVHNPMIVQKLLASICDKSTLQEISNQFRDAGPDVSQKTLNRFKLGGLDEMVYRLDGETVLYIFQSKSLGHSFYQPAIEKLAERVRLQK